jgi:small ligand-binding sensory domain FIST
MRFAFGHAAHPDWRRAADKVVEQLSAQGASSPRATLGIVYASAVDATQMGAVLSCLREKTGVSAWVGASAQGICATGAEYFDEPALAVMLMDLALEDFQFFSGRQGLPRQGVSQPMSGCAAMVHADPGTPELAELLTEMATRIGSGEIFGGIVSGGPDTPLPQVAGEVVVGGLSGVLFSDRVRLLSRVTQGCAPLAREHVISDCVSHYIKTLDGQPALDVMLEDLGVQSSVRHSRDGEEILRALPRQRLRRGLLVGLASPSHERAPIGFGDYLVRNLVGIDPQNRLLAVAALPERGERIVFCTRDQQAARADLIRICTELREEIESQALTVRGALYHTCVARGESLFGSRGAEMQIIQHNLGDIPLVGMFANGEIAHNRLYGHTGVLTLFV